MASLNHIMKSSPLSLTDRLELAAQACHAAHLLSCEATCREAITELERTMTSATPKPRAGEHTKGPWRAGKPQGGSGLVWADGVAVADCLNGDGSDDARRIVACVNACEGISDELLQTAYLRLQGKINQLEAERDLLREQLEACKAAHMSNCLDADKLRAQNRALRAVVARVDELSEAFDLQTDKGRCALANEIRILGVAARAPLTRSTDRRE